MNDKDLRSRHDDLFDRYHSIATTKSGTRYELLAAIVCKTLEDRGVVIHDLKLLGESGVKHQVGVTVETASKTRRYLIECKDFDVAADKVGLDIVRSFDSVVRDTASDEGWIVTCNGFTRDALEYAKTKRIKPVVMRLFENGVRAAACR